MNGDISVESVYGEGSVFSLSIHQKHAQDTPAARYKDDRPVRVGGRFASEYMTEELKLLCRQFGVVYVANDVSRLPGCWSRCSCRSTRRTAEKKH